MNTRNPELPEAEPRAIAEPIGIAAVRYFLIKFSRTKVIAFDFEEALSFEGETGPYLQYAACAPPTSSRSCRSAAACRRQRCSPRSPTRRPRRSPTAMAGTHELWALVLEASRLDEVVEQVAAPSLEFSGLAKYAFGPRAGLQRLLPNKSSIVNEDREDVRRWRVAAVAPISASNSRTALDLMGVRVPSRM